MYVYVHCSNIRFIIIWTLVDLSSVSRKHALLRSVGGENMMCKCTLIRRHHEERSVADVLELLRTNSRSHVQEANSKKIVIHVSNIYIYYYSY